MDDLNISQIDQTSSFASGIDQDASKAIDHNTP